MASGNDSTTNGPAIRIARALASPIGVLITIPLLVIAVGVGILLVGRDATRGASRSMAQGRLAEQAIKIQTDITFALDQAGPLLERLRVLADPARSADDVLLRMADLIVGRPGVAYASISFTDGTFRGAYLGEHRRLEVQESKVTDKGTHVERFTIDGSKLTTFRTETTEYDPRQRAFYQLAERIGARTWTEPYTFFRSFETGISCAEPVYRGQRLVAVLTVDFDVGALSSYVARPALDEARSVMFTRDGIILAYPSADKLALPTGDKLLRHEDLRDPALTSLFKAIGQDGGRSDRQQILELDASDGGYLTSVAPLGGKRAGIAVPLDWFVATVVPERTLLGPTHRFERSAVVASAIALAIAVAIALILAWNLVRMRRQVAASRAEARSAEQRARELGSYRLVAKLGAGGMGEVWRAEHRLLARSAAIKLIRAEALVDPEGAAEIRERFRREAQTLASMRSRHTIAIFDYGVTETGVFYYVMELLDGLDMESLIVRDGGQPAARVIQMMIQACASLAEAHDAGLFHRDIKPPNLFVSRVADEVDVIKLLDFGIVQTVNELPAPQRAVLPREELPSSMSRSKLTQMGAMLGTPGFMAPEQILGMQLDGRADLYALGCVMWWLLTGSEVFAREGVDANILHQHIYEPIPSLAARMTSWCPAELEAVMNTMLAKEPDERPRDARHLAAMLRAIPIPPAYAWTEATAQAWWASYRPAAAETSVSPSEVQVIMPGATDQRSASSEIAGSPTLVRPG